MIKQEKGYTLFELIIVITILGLLLLIAVPSYHSISKTNEIEHFFQQLQEDLYLTQMTAISRGKLIMLDFRTTSKQYQIRMDNTAILSRHYSKQISVENGTLETKIEFNPNGNIRKPGTIFVNTSKGKYKLTFQLGKGRFYVTKL